MTLVAYEINGASIADFTDENLLKEMGCSIQDLACAWEDLASQQLEPPTWLLTDRLRGLDVAGILVRSFASGCTAKNRNLILWNWSESESNEIRVIDDFGRLPKSIESWITH